MGGNKKTAVITLILLVSFLSLSLCVTGFVSAQQSDGNWTMFHQNPSHTGYLGGGSQASSVQLLWNYTTDRMVQSSPAIAYGCLVVGSRDSQVYCFNASNGEVIWKHAFGCEVWSSPAIYNYSVYFGSDDGYLYCLNIMTGTPFWRTQIGNQVRSSPAVADGIVYASSNSNLYALNASNGNTIWDVQNLNSLYSSPVVSEGEVYASSINGYICAFNASTGSKIWSSPLRTSDLSSPIVCNGYVYIGSYDGWVFALNASSGAEIWKYETADEVDSTPAVANGCVYIGSDDNNVYCLNASTGGKIWQSPTGYWVTSSPAVAGGNVYVGSQDGCVYCFSTATGAKEWSYQTGDAIESSPAIADNTLFIGSDDAKIYAFAQTNSTDKNSQLTSSLPMTTIAFDVAGFVVVAAVIFALGYSVYFSRRSKGNDASYASELDSSCLRRHTDFLLVLAILAFSSIFFVNLGHGVLQVSDEQTYSQWAYHMVKTGDYLTPWDDGAVILMIGKPPLLEWMMALGYQVFGVSNFGARIGSAILGAVSLVFVFFLGRKLYNRAVGFTSAIVLGTFATYYTFARYAMTDVPLTCFILGSIYFFLLSQDDERPARYAVVSGVFFGLALMTKQVAALLIPIIIFAYLLVTKRSLRFLFTKNFTLLWGTGLLLFSSWLTYMAVRFGNSFWQAYFISADLTRSVSTVEGHVGGYLFYFNYLATNEFWLWLALLPFAVSLCIYGALFKRRKQDTLVLLWLTIVLAVFSLAQTKIYWYIIPVLPAFALAIASLLYQLARKINQRISTG